MNKSTLSFILLLIAASCLLSQASVHGQCQLMGMVIAQGNILAEDWVSTLGLPDEYKDNYGIWDIERFELDPSTFGNGIPDLWQLALFANSFCNNRHRLHNAAVAAYEANMAWAVGDFPESAPYVEWFAASAAISSEMRDTVYSLFGVDPAHYAAVSLPGKATNEPFSAEGDCDGDGVNNLAEYESVVTAGGDIDAFISEASENNHFWSGNPNLPIGTATILASAALLVILALPHLKGQKRKA